MHIIKFSSNHVRRHVHFDCNAINHTTSILLFFNTTKISIRFRDLGDALAVHGAHAHYCLIWFGVCGITPWEWALKFLPAPNAIRLRLQVVSSTTCQQATGIGEHVSKSSTDEKYTNEYRETFQHMD